MFGFGVGETAAAIAAVIQGLKSLNDALATVKQTAATGSEITGLVSKYADLEEKIRDVEQRKAGVLSVEDSMNLQIAKQQSQNFHRALKDSLLVQQGGAAQYREIMARIEESKAAHERKVAQLKRKRREREKLLKEIGLYVTIGSFCILFAIGGLYVYMQIFVN